MKPGSQIAEWLGEGNDETTVARRAMIMRLGEQVESIERSISLVMQYYAERCGLTLIESQALAKLFDQGGSARLSVIAECVRMPLSTMTGVAARLEKSGLAERERASDDRRASILTITPAGQEKLRELFVPFFTELTSVIDEGGDEALQSVLDAFEMVATMAESLQRRVPSSAD